MIGREKSGEGKETVDDPNILIAANGMDSLIFIDDVTT